MRLFPNGVIGAVSNLQQSFFPTTVHRKMPKFGDYSQLMDQIVDKTINLHREGKHNTKPSVFNGNSFDVMFVSRSSEYGDTEAGLQVRSFGHISHSLLLVTQQPYGAIDYPGKLNIDYRWGEALLSLPMPQVYFSVFTVKYRSGEKTRLHWSLSLERLVGRNDWRRNGLEMMLNVLSESRTPYPKLTCD